MATDLVEVEEQQNIFLPAMTMAQAVCRYDSVLEFTKKIMKEGKDYGTIPGVEKPCLLKPGAEKLCSFFGIVPRLIVLKEEEDWSGAKHGEPFFYYHYKVQLWRGDCLLGEADGSANSMEAKHRYRWVQEDQVPPGLDKATLKTRGGRISEFAFAIAEAKTDGKYAKPAAYWQEWKDAIAQGRAIEVNKTSRNGKTMAAWERDSRLYRIPNPDIADCVNTLQKMAYKRALVAVSLIVCNASEYFTQDVEDQEYIDPHPTPAPTQEQKPEQKAPESDDDAKTITAAQYADLVQKIDHAGADKDAVLDHYHVRRPSQLPVHKYHEALSLLEQGFAPFFPSDANED